MITGRNSSVPFRNEESGQSDVLKGVEERLMAMEEQLKSTTTPPINLRNKGANFKGMGQPSTDADLVESRDATAQITEGENSDRQMMELLSRLSDIENRLPEFKGLNSFDTRLPFLKSSATLSEVISTVNKILQRTISQDRLK